MFAATDRSTLVLNADYRPIGTYPLSLVSGRRAISAVIRDRVNVVEEWDQAFNTATMKILVPKTMALKEYKPIHSSPKFCRRSILLRDRFNCQYCGNRFQAAELTFDHVIPRANGGQTTWDNILSACVPCNIRKRDLPANWSGRKGFGMRPLKAPRQPTANELLRAGLEFLSDHERETWADWLYWSAELSR